MILKGSQRSGAGRLAKHLLKTTENEHVEVHEIRGFIADRLDRALEEIYAISRGTKCSQFMFSLSLNPPEEEDVPVEVFEAALARIENALGLTGQQRVVVFHEKKGRRHAHCVWSRIRASTMTAINLPHFKRKLSDISKQLFLEHGWKLPNGFKDRKKRDPLNFTLEEWQQARRQKRDPRELKTLLQTCWKQANSRRALERALEDNGFFLAQGDRRGYVALSAFGDVYALRRWIGVRTKELEAKLGSPDQLRSVTLTRQLIAERMKRAIDRFAKGFTEKAIIESKAAREQRNALTAIHNKQRELLDTQTFFELLKQPYPTTQQAVLEKLLAEKLIDRTEHGYSIRRMGAILLARRFSEFSDISRKACRVIVYKGRSKLETRLDQVWEKGYACGFQGLVGYIMDQLPQNEVIQDALRTEKKLVPEIVIRELVANALVHQDFSVTGASVMIEIYDNRVEISNPGLPIVSVERFIDGFQSRNERLADLMRRMHICEEKGSGIDKVVTAIEFSQLPPLDFKAQNNRTYVYIFGHKIFEDMNRAERLRACYQHACLKWVLSDGMTNQSLRERFKLPESKSTTISQIIAAAQDEGLIKPDEKIGGSRRFARYLPFWA